MFPGPELDMTISGIPLDTAPPLQILSREQGGPYPMGWGLTQLDPGTPRKRTDLPCKTFQILKIFACGAPMMS